MEPGQPRDEPYVALEELYDEEHLALMERARVAARAAEAALAGDEGGVVIELFEDDEAWDDAGEPATAGAGGRSEGEILDGRGTTVGRRLRRFGASGGVLAGMMLGVGEVLEPDKIKTHEIDYAPAPEDEDSQLVTFHLVKGDPQASRLVIRPWLLDRVLERRRRRAAAEPPHDA